MNSMRHLALVTSALFWMSSAAFAKPGALINYKDGKVTAELAKSWKQINSKSYEFKLDLSKKVQEQPLTAKMVVDTIESKLGRRHEITGKIVNKETIRFSYGIDTDRFLKAVSKTKIRTRTVVQMEPDKLPDPADEEPPFHSCAKDADCKSLDPKSTCVQRLYACGIRASCAGFFCVDASKRPIMKPGK